MEAVTKRRGTVRSAGRERRQLIIDAVLRIVAREGIRAVRHRAVAAEAGVPLAATTYYFKDIQELLTESFAFFSRDKSADIAEYRNNTAEFLQLFPTVDKNDTQRRLELAQYVRDSTVNFVLQQARRTNDRAIELAFKHEALHDEAIRDLIIDQDKRFIANVRAFMEAFGSTEPVSDAEAMLSIMLRLEQESVIAGLVDASKIHRVISRYLGLLMQVELG